MSETIVPEYKQIINKGTAGTFVKETQGVASEEGFSNISKFWYPQTISYEDALENLEKERAEREDITGDWSDWEFVLEGKGVSLLNKDGRKFNPSEYSLMQAIGWAETPQTFVKQTLSEEFEADEKDLDLLCQTLNYRKQRNHQTNKGETRELLFRTYNSTELRAVLTKQFCAIDNRWFIQVLSDLIPSGRISHQRGDCDDLYANVLMPDNVRFDQDSDYGGMFSVRNSEIGRASLDTRPSTFRAICGNGCVWSQEFGLSFRQVHRGKIELDGLAVKIGENLDKQIKLLPEIMEKFLSLRQYEFSNVALTGVFASISERFKLTPKQAGDAMSQFAKYESGSRNAFGVVNSFTRSGQLYDAETCLKFDLIGGELATTNWDSIVGRAKTYTEKDLAKILGVSA